MKPENRMISKVHTALDARIVYAEKTHNPLRAGVPDCYYEGQRTAWIEYKFLPSIPVKATFSLGRGLGKGKSILTELQDRWLTRAFNSGAHAMVAVVVGFKNSSRTYRFRIFPAPELWQNEYGETGDELLRYSLSLEDYRDFLYEKLAPGHRRA